jgi:signal transduction histidine kinase
MTLRYRLATALLTIAVILVIPLLIAVQSLNSLHRDAVDLQKGEFAASLLLGRLREGLYDLRRQETRLLFVHDSAARDAIAKQIADVDQLADSLEHYQLTGAAVGVRGAIRQIAKWGPIEYQAALSGKGNSADTISTTYIIPAIDSADVGVRSAEHDLWGRTTERVSQQATSIKKGRAAAIVGMLLALIIAAVIAIWLMRSIIKPVIALEAGMQAVADGQLDHKLNYDTTKQHEFGRLARSFQGMASQLGELDKLKAEFVSVASHELKTPLNVIIGYLQLLEEGLFGPLTPKQLEVLQTIASQTQSLHRLVKQLLDVSRFEAGGNRVEPKQVHLSKLLDDLERAFHVLALQRDVTFTIERSGTLPEEVLWDIDRVNEVLGNLLSNAFKFTGKGGRVDLVVEPADHSVQMVVRDTGAGIPPEQLPHVFEKFYQADNQGSASAEGSGLGLAIAKQIVEAHGGTITCDSTIGVGTTFTLTLPAQVKRRSASQRVAAPA